MEEVEGYWIVCIMYRWISVYRNVMVAVHIQYLGNKLKLFYVLRTSTIYASSSCTTIQCPAEMVSFE